MKQIGFYFNMNQCLGCKSCQVACKDKNNLEEGVFFRRVTSRQIMIDGKLQWVNFSGSCNHCKRSACTVACPTGAMYKSEDGTVLHDRGKCIGCGSCVSNCPYGAPFISPKGGYAQKCNACQDIRAEGKMPACVAACPTHALRFGDFEELCEKYGSEAVYQIPILPDQSSTLPSLLIGLKNNPKCGCKIDFNKIIDEIEPQYQQINTDETFVILGNGIAGVRAAMAIRQHNTTAKIILVGDEPILPYSRTMLSKAALRGFNIEKYLIFSPEWYRNANIDLRLNSTVTAIYADTKVIELKGADDIRYDKCIYALGADSFIPPIPGSDKQGIFVVRRQSDIEEMRKKLLSSKQAVIIGGGVIGLEIAWELKRSGINVTVIELAKTLMERLLDMDTAFRLENGISDAGIHVITGAQIERITGDKNADGVLLKDGTHCPADFVILSTGIRANVMLAKDAGIETNRAIVVNEKMETSVAGIYACGDCAEYKGVNTGTWTQSQEQGYIAGANAAGDKRDYIMTPAPILVHAGGISLFSIGDMGKNENLVYTRYSNVVAPAENAYKVNPHSSSCEAVETYYAVDGKVVGAALIGNLEKMYMVQAAVREQRYLEDIIESKIKSE